VILLCDEGYQSSLAAATLQQLGFARATDALTCCEGWDAPPKSAMPTGQLTLSPPAAEREFSPGAWLNCPLETLKPEKAALMATADEGIAAQIRNIEARYGKPMPDWLALIAASGLVKHTEVVAMLKTEHGLTHGAAHRGRPEARRATPARTHPGPRPRRSRSARRPGSG